MPLPNPTVMQLLYRGARPSPRNKAGCIVIHKPDTEGIGLCLVTRQELCALMPHRTRGDLPTQNRGRHLSHSEDPQLQLVKALQSADCFPHPIQPVKLLQTHISYVLLTGKYAYKLKKAVDLGFLDFSTLEQRRFFCYEELRLNSRFAPELYIDVVKITGSHTDPQINGDGPIVEYAVRMHQFPSNARLDQVCQRGELSAAHIDQLADSLARFHRNAPCAAHESTHGTAATIAARVMENFAQINEHEAARQHKETLEALKSWSLIHQRALSDDMELRRREGWIRECHGDLHLANCALFQGKVVMFDALEFADDLRWIDPLSEIAFLYMDLKRHAYSRLANRFLNRYLEAANDYQALHLLRYYLVYRALVRAKIAAIATDQPFASSNSRSDALTQLQSYLDTALQYCLTPAPGPLILMHGYSGSGKSQLALQLVETLGAIRIRSDVERKRLLGLNAEACTQSEIASGAYSQSITNKTYKRMLALAYPILEAGFPVIIDATHLQRMQRKPFQRLAKVANVPFVIVDLQAPIACLQERIQTRRDQQHDASEATLAVLEHQRATAEPFETDELTHVIEVDSRDKIDLDALARQILLHQTV